MASGYGEALKDSGDKGTFFGSTPDDQFERGRRLGKGGQATVYECKRLNTGKSYAVKVIEMKSMAFQRQSEQNLRREIRNMEELFHRNIVNLLTHIWEDSRCLLVMDLARGGDLHNKVFEEANISVDNSDEYFPGLGGSELASRHVAKQLIDAMGYMHSKLIVHRDMKLENVLICRTYAYTGPDDGTQRLPSEVHDVKITDFGLSKNVTSQPNLLRCSTAVGSPDFVAPEVLDGASLTQTSDFWSFGVMIYAMICGEWPFAIRGSKDLEPSRHKEVVSKINACRSWQAASQEVHLLVEGLLCIDMEKRFGQTECLNSKWITSKSEEDDELRMRRSPSKTDPGSLQGVISEVSGCVGYALDNVELKLRNGSTQFFGIAGGDVQHCYTLKPNELIVSVMQEEREDFLGLALTFQTSKGQVLSLKGSQARKRRCFNAPAGTQIVGLQFDGSRLIGILLEKVSKEEPGTVASISGRVGHAVDQVAFRLRDGTIRDYGNPHGGTEQGPWALEPGEYIVSVEQLARDAFLGNSLAFYTSAGSIFQLKGMEASGCRRFAVPPRQQICGLQFEGSLLFKVVTCPLDGNLAIQQTHRLNC